MQLSPQALPAEQILQQMRAGGSEVGTTTTMGVQVGDGSSVGIGVHVGANGSGFVATGKGVRDMVVAVCVIVGVNVFVAAGKGVRNMAVGVYVIVGVNVRVSEGAPVAVKVGRCISARVG